MKSPLTGREMKLMKEKCVKKVFKKENFEISYYY